jgi:hypothetical protein
MTTDIQNLKSFDPFAEAEDSVGDIKTTSQNYIHIRIQREFCLFPSPLYSLVRVADPFLQSAMVVRR